MKGTWGICGIQNAELWNLVGIFVRIMKAAAPVPACNVSAALEFCLLLWYNENRERRQRMTLQKLKYIIMIAETGSITMAAERLFIAQPSLSKSVAELEKEMGIPMQRYGLPENRLHDRTQQLKYFSNSGTVPAVKDRIEP